MISSDPFFKSQRDRIVALTALQQTRSPTEPSLASARPLRRIRAMSALPPKADIETTLRDVR